MYLLYMYMCACVAALFYSKKVDPDKMSQGMH